ncbi:MAG: hypothetical protein ACRD4B_05780, partial [Acidobacteriota bacterium]
MKRLLLALGLVLLVGLLWAGTAIAEVRSGANPQVAEDQVVDRDLFVAGETVEIRGTVNGNVFAAAQTIRVSGTINGDIYAAAEAIEISGNVRDDIQVAARTLTLKGAEVGDGVVVAAETASLNEQSKIGGGLLFATKTLDGNAPIGRGIVGAGDEINVNATVGHEVRVDAGQLSFGERADVKDDVTYRSGNDAAIAEGAEIVGQVQRSYRRDGDSWMAAWLVRFAGGFLIWSYLAALVTGVVLLAIFKRPTLAIVDTLTAQTKAAALCGLVT